MRGLHLKSAEREKCDERMKFLGLSEMLKTITVKLTTSFLPLLLYSIDKKCNQIYSSSSFCRSMRLLLTVSNFQSKMLFFRTEFWRSPLMSLLIQNLNPEYISQGKRKKKKKECLQPCLLPRDLMKDCRHHILFN